MSDYRAAIDLTISVITQRSRVFRNQVVALVAIALGSVVGAVGLGKLWPLTGLLTLMPACGLFLWFDARRVTKWQSAILAMWARRAIDLLAFGHAMRANPVLPDATLNGMLSLLGTSQIGTLEAQASAETRQAVAAVARFADALGLRQFAAKVCASAIVSASICWSAAAHTWTPLALATPILLLPPVLRWLRLSLQRQSSAAIQFAQQDPGFDADAFHCLVDHMRTSKHAPPLIYSSRSAHAEATNTKRS